MDILWSCTEGLGKYVNLDEKMQNLKWKLELLEVRAADKSIEVQNLEFQTGRKRKREVENWLRNVQSKKDEVRSIEQEVHGSIFLSCIHLGNQIEKTTQEVEELLEQGKFAEGFTVDVHEPLELLTVKLVGQKAEESMKKVLACIMDDRVFSLGIYGMGGVGKTTLAMHIHNELLKNPRSYDYVYWITVSQQFSIYKLQGDIAKELSLENLPSEENERKRAATLFRGLANRKKTVLILDDMWEHFTLEKVGIPIGPDGPKLILTTRSLSVCRQMGSQEIIKVEPLSNDEAWELFMEKLKPYDTLSMDVKVAAMSLARECRGLPLGIITMARSMRGVDDIHEWRTAVKELRESNSGRPDMEEEVFSILRISYGRLKDPKVQQCFLYCALYPEDSEMEREELIRYFIAEGLIDGMDSRQAEFDKGHTILNELENTCLLENAKRKVKMHDLVRDMALQISGKSSSTAGPRFLVKAGLKLREIPEDWAQDLERVSLMHNDITEIKAGISPRCPKLLTLMLQHNIGLKKIADSFLLQMCALKVLDLSGNCDLERLPNTISDLENLTALLLGYCKSLKYVPSLAKLLALKELNLGKTGIEKAPDGMANLVNLKVLYMDCYTKNVVVGEEILHQMRDLEKFVGRIGDVRRFPPRLNAYSIMVGSGVFYDFPSLQQCSKAVTHVGCSVNTEILVHLSPNIDYLRFKRCHDLRALPGGTFSSLEVLEVLLCPKIKKLFPDRLVRHLQNLKCLSVGGCDSIEEIIGEVEENEDRATADLSITCSASNNKKIGIKTIDLPKLRYLELWELPELKSICRGKMVCDTLKIVAIEACPKLKRLPLYLPLHPVDGQPSPPPALQGIITKDDEWWELLVWDHPAAKPVLQPFLNRY
ncbi:probable disease resistance protein At1g15890 [Malania oleifera]|uniref:probable disease resistance protein At1g15890 n=1 Tax=Malania oleifera TaxID=397392 RepID=UPI0025ADF34E|nr:probable disease resistance protein At1g15890 [Malania oleifera]